MRDDAPQDILAFWREAGPQKWFAKDEAFDAAIAGRFAASVEAALGGAFEDWRAAPDATLALTLLLDQFPRNLFRGQAKAFAGDARARDIARQALARGFDTQVDPALATFPHLPFMHSEALADQELCVALCRWRHDANTLRFAVIHRDIVARFGRFPHRNAALGRATTADEQAFLDDPDSFKG